MMPATHSSLAGLSIISAMITPAILILASGNLVASTLTRLARVVDRARIIIDRLEECQERQDAAGVHIYSDLLKDYRRRTAFVERSLSAFYGAIGFFVATSLTIAFDNFVANVAPWLGVALTVTGVLLLLLGTLTLVLETNMAAGILYREMELTARYRNTSKLPTAT